MATNIYLHHDGPGYYNDDRGEERALKFKWRDDAVKTYERVFKSKLLLLTNLLKQKVETKLKLTDSDGKSIANKNYVLATALLHKPSLGRLFSNIISK